MRTDTIKLSDKKNTRVVAHRGVSGLETENTAAAFIAAGNRTHYGVETDIWRTADGRFLCNHDGRTGRICDVDLVIEQSSFDELRALTLRDKDGVSDRAELMLATPAEYRKICEKYGKHAVPELKSNFTSEEIKSILNRVDLTKDIELNHGGAAFISDTKEAYVDDGDYHSFASEVLLMKGYSV